MRRTAVPLLVASLALAAPAAAQELGPATAAQQRSVQRHPATSGTGLNPGRAATVLARLFRSEGDDPRQIGCRMVARNRATCQIIVIRAGARWTGTGTVWQSRHMYRANYEIHSPS